MGDVSLLESLIGIDEQKRKLYDNTRQFAEGFPSNNALLWGVRGMGKSSLVKSVVSSLQGDFLGERLVLVEIYREDLGSFHELFEVLRDHRDKRVIIFCDDLSFDSRDADYKSLKSVLEGGIEGRPSHVLFYATSNRRHLMARGMGENEEKASIHMGEAVEEHVSLSDRFGLWLGFHAMDQETYLKIVSNYVESLGGELEEGWEEFAKAWSRQRGHLSGRVAYQCACDMVGRFLTRAG
jgi:hypothetical protein